MTCRRARNVLTALLVAASCGAVSAEPRPPVVPDLELLRDTCLDLIADVRRRTFPDAGAEIDLKCVTFDRIERNRRLVPPETWGPGEDVYLVQITEYAVWYKESISYVLVLRPRTEGFDRLLVYAGGFGESSLDCETVDLDDRKYFEAMNAFHPVLSLMIRDHSSGTGYSQERLLLFRYCQEERCFCNIYDTRLSFAGGQAAPYEAFRSTVEFRAPARRGRVTLKDVAISTDWFVSRPNDASDLFGRDSTLDRHVSIITWDGEKYTGQLDLPPNARLRHLGREGQWFPAESDVDAGQPGQGAEGPADTSDRE